MSQGKAGKKVRHFCLECQGGSSGAVMACKDSLCALFPLRLCTLQPLDTGVRILRQIRTHCLNCSGSRQDVRSCSAREACALWSYRFGVLPSTFKRVMLRHKKRQETLMLPGFLPKKI